MEIATQETKHDDEAPASASTTTTTKFEAATGFSLMHYAALHGSVKVAEFLATRWLITLFYWSFC
jgi:hypothetical protein